MGAINKMYADMIIRDARIITLSDKQEKAESLAIWQGKIINIGGKEEISKLITSSTKILDLGGETILPGFIDSHVHIFPLKKEIGEISLYSTSNKQEALLLLKEKRRASSPNSWIIGTDYEEYRWKPFDPLQKEELDYISPSGPMLIIRLDGHEGVANSLSLKLIPFSLREDKEGHKFVEESGLVKEKALNFLLKEINRGMTKGDIKEGIKKNLDKALSLGITSLHLILDRGKKDLEVLTELNKEGRLNIRVYTLPYIEGFSKLYKAGILSTFGNERIRIGALKIILDGDVISKTAAISYFYPTSSDQGIFNYTPSYFSNLVKKAHQAGYQLAIHAIGDRAIELTLQALDKAVNRYPQYNLRHRIEHFELATEDQIKRAKELGVILSMQPCLLGRSYVYRDVLGEGWEKKNNLLGLIAKENVPLALGSDLSPSVKIAYPWEGIKEAVTARNLKQKLNLVLSLKSYTKGGAFASFEENIKGTLEEGKLADMLILDKDPFSVNEKDLGNVSIWATIVGGKIVFVHPKAPKYISKKRGFEIENF